MINILCANSFACDISCIETAKTNKDLDECGNQIVPIKEAKIEHDFNTLFGKYKNNDEMKIVLKYTKQSWEGYKNLLCNCEGAAAAGGQVKGILPFEANKEYLKCVIRTLERMNATLLKWNNYPLVLEPGVNRGADQGK